MFLERVLSNFEDDIVCDFGILLLPITMEGLDKAIKNS